MAAERAGSSTGGQAKAVPVEQTAAQLCPPIATAENPRGATRRTTRDRLGAVLAGAPEAIVKAETAAPATMEEVAKRPTSAPLKVASNKGAPGPDGQTIEALVEQWPVVLPRLQADLLQGRYRPGEIRRAHIPKAGGGQRGLGIPDVVDRVVCEAVRRVLEPLWEPTFHPSSHGFRPGRSCHTAITEAGQHLKDGYEWVADLDLEKFFDLVCHQRLTAKLAERVGDRRLLVLIGRLLKAKVVLPDGVVIDSEQGVPQGSPLSPLLSNIVLDELDRELARRGHRFVRYADDAKVYVRGERAGQRVMASLTEFIERRLRLKVNDAESAVARPEERHFLGLRPRLDAQTGAVEVLLSERAKRNAMERVRQLTPRNWGGSLDGRIARINAWLRGWHGFFGIASASEMQMMGKLDAHIRRRLRAIILRHWKRKRTIAQRLVALGVKRRSAWRQVYAGRKSWWALSHMHAVDQGLRNYGSVGAGAGNRPGYPRPRRALRGRPPGAPLVMPGVRPGRHRPLTRVRGAAFAQVAKHYGVPRRASAKTMPDRAESPPTSVRERIQHDTLFLDSAVVSHGFAPFLRDYDVIIDVPAAKPDGTGSYIQGRYRYRFTHCPEAIARTTVTPEAWQQSWPDLFTDYQQWEHAGQPSGYVWGVGHADAYPGLSYIDDSEPARRWSTLLEHEMHEASINTNALVLELVFHGLAVAQIAIGDPASETLRPQPE